VEVGNVVEGLGDDEAAIEVEGKREPTKRGRRRW
jgi:hypothetical protein